MASTRVKEIHAPVKRIGEAIIVPETIKLREASRYLGQLADQEEMDVDIDEFIDGYLFADVAYCFNKAIETIHGYSLQKTKTVSSFFGEFKVPPKLLTVATSLKTSIQVPWGEFTLPGVEGTVELTPFRRSGSMFGTRIYAQIKQRDKERVQKVVNLTREFLRTESVFKGQPFSLELKDAEGNYKDMPLPSFIDVENTVNPIFNRDVEAEITASVYAPIARTAELRANNIPLKRGVCLYGPFGTGKTQTSRRVAQLAKENGWTFIKVEAPDEFADILRLARNFQPCVVFCEDIDRITAGRRTVKLDEILNNLDGIDSKGAEILVVVTTNEFDDINRAMLRAGRLDASIPVPYPDQDASERLLRFYAGDLLEDDEDITAACKEMADKIPASAVEEVIKRSKLFILSQRFENNEPVDTEYRTKLNGRALRDAAIAVVKEHVNNTKEVKRRDLSTATPQERAAYIVADANETAAEIRAKAMLEVEKMRLNGSVMAHD